MHLRRLYKAVVSESREGRAAEVVAWSNALASLAMGGGVYAWLHAWTWAALGALGGFVLLRGCMMHRRAIWASAVLGTVAVATAAGALGWIFGHAVESPNVPYAIGVASALLGAAAPAWAYGRFIRRRDDEVPDSLLEPASLVPSSRW